MPPHLERHFSPYDVPNGSEMFENGHQDNGPPEPYRRIDQPEERGDQVDEPEGYRTSEVDFGTTAGHIRPDELPVGIDEAAGLQSVTFSVPSAAELEIQRTAIQHLVRDGLGPEASDARIAYMTEAIMDTSQGAQAVLVHDNETGQPVGALTVRFHPVEDGSIVWAGADAAFVQEAQQWADMHGVPLQAGSVQAVIVASDQQGEDIAREMLRMADSGYMPAAWVAFTRDPDYAFMQSRALGDYRTFAGDRQEITPGNVQETTIHHVVTLASTEAFAATVDIQVHELQQGPDDQGAALPVLSIRSAILDRLDTAQASNIVDGALDQKPVGDPVSLFVQTPVVNKDIPSKPGLGGMEAYFARRLRLVEPQDNTVIAERDNLGNELFIYPGIREETLAGESPAMTTVSPEGRDLLNRNPDLMRDLYRGTFVPIGQPFDGPRSLVYRVPLQNDRGEEDYAVKYNFPYYEGGGPTYDHTSGVMAMRFMQYAQQDQPVPHITYASPVIATHTITVAPFAHDGLSVDSFLGRGMPDDSWLSVIDIQRLKEMRQDRSQLRREFFATIGDVVKAADNALGAWAHGLIRRHPEFQAFHFHAGDANLHRQGVISVGGIYAVYKRFLQDASYREGGLFKEDVLRNIAVVELADGFVDLPDNE